MSSQLAALAAASALLFSSASWATPPVERSAARADGAKFIQADLNVGHAPLRLSRPLRQVAQSCKDKCEADRDACYNACPSDAVPGAVCRDGCGDTYEACLKGC